MEESKEQPAQNGAQEAQDDQDEPTTSKPSTEAVVPSTNTSAADSTAAARLDAMQQERDNLRAEVTHLRETLEQLQANQGDEIPSLREELEAITGRERRSRDTIPQSVEQSEHHPIAAGGERLKADAEELELARGRIEELEQEQSTTNEDNERLQSSIANLTSQLESQASEIDTLRSRTNLSTSNWAKERDDLISREAYVREEYEVARQAMQDWEILATEERSRREAAE